MVLSASWMMVVNLLILFSLVITKVLGSKGDDLLFSNKQDIRQFKFGDGNYTPVLGGLEYVRSLDYDFNEKRLFFISLHNNEKTVIQSMNLKNKDEEPKVIVDTATQLENDFKTLAVDWLSKKIYFTDLLRKRVEVVDYDGLYRRVIVFTGLQQPDGLALFPQKGLMFVTDWGSTKKIERFNMDGSGRKIIYDDHRAWGRSITVDYATSTIYWGDTMQNMMASMDIEGNNLRYYSLTHSPNYITVSTLMVYWSDGEVISGFKKGGNPNNSTVSISELKGTKISPNDIRVYTNYRQPEFLTSCAKDNGGCSHLCLLSLNGYTCACQTGVALKKDNKTCEDGMKKFLVVARRENIRLVSLDIDKSVDFRLKVDRKYTRNVHGVAYDVERKRVYWADTGCTDKSIVNDIVDCSDPGSINSIFLNGTGFEQFVTQDIKAPDHIAVDWIARNIYWTDGVLSRIEVSRLDGTSRKIIISDYLHKPRGLTIDPADAKLYWSDWGNVSKIERSDLNGDNREVLVEKEAEWPNAIALDLQGRKLYWADARRKISYYDLNSRQVRTLYDNADHPFGITILGDYIYWTDWFRKVVRLKLEDTKAKRWQRDKEKVILNEIADVMGICAVDTSIKYGTNPCDYKKNNCSHLCFVKPNRGVAMCDCPTRMELTKDDRTCQVPSGYLIYSVSKKILKSSIDTFKRKKHLPLSNTNRVSRLDVHYKTNRMVWLDEEGHRELSSINSGFINGSDFRVIMKVDSTEVESLAIDWMSQNVYIAMQKSNHIDVIRIDGSHRNILIFDEDLIAPRCVLVNPHLSKLYWAHRKNNSTHALFQANLDGSEVKELFKITILSICAIDYTTHVIYCIVDNDKLISFDPIKGVKSDVRSYLSGWMSMVIFRGDIIHTNIYAETISKISTNPSDTTGPINLIKVSDPMDFKIFHPDVQTGENICSRDNGGCQHFCFALSKTKARCGCATHYTLAANKKNCLEPKSFLIVNQNNNFLRILFPYGVPDYALPIVNTKRVGPIAFDDIRDYIYWLQKSDKLIYRAFQNGTGGHGTIQLQTDVQRRRKERCEPYDITLDPFSNTLFWTDKAQNTINFLNMYTGARGVVFNKQGYSPRKIIAYPDGGKLFWTSVDEIKRKTVLFSITFAGTETEDLKILDRSVLDDLTIDYTSKLLYYLDTEKNLIVSLSFKGQHKKKYRIDPSFSPVSLATNNEDIFWSDKTTIYKIAKDASLSDASKFFHGRYEGISEIISVNISRKKKSHPCLGNNGGCSHICRISYEVSLSSKENPQAAICGCPLHFHLDSTNSKNCTVAEMCAINQIFCKEDSKCISAEMKCDGKNDCSDGQDETDPDCDGLFPRPPCPQSYRRCGSTQKCVRLSEWCDGEKNCPNNEDEETCFPCKKDQFSCDGACLDVSLKCNGDADCSDLSDEKDCPTPTLPTSVTVQIASTAHKKSRMLAAVVSGVVICIICFMFAIWLYFKIRNSKKNSSNQAAGTSAWALQQLKSLSSSDNNTKSSISTYISNDASFYDRNNMTGQSDVCDSEFSQLIFNPPPSPVTERSMSTITAARNNTLYNDYEIPRCDHCQRRLIGDESIDLEGEGLDPPPPTVASSNLMDDVDMYFPTNWSQKSGICEDCQSTAASTQSNNIQANGRNLNNGVNSRHVRCSDVPRTSGHLHNICESVSEFEVLDTPWMYYSNENPNLDRQYGEEPLFIDSNGHLIDPPPSPCTYLSEEDRPPSPDFSELHRRETHFAPPPSPTSQLL